MEFLRPASWREALEAKAAHPDATPIAGGTDVMVELNFDRARPGALLDLTAVPEAAEWAPDGSELRIGAGVPYTRLIDELGTHLPGLAMASRTVGSPQIRNRGTLGGNLGSASPAGDGHPPLLASGASIEVESVRGSRVIPAEEFCTAPKRNALEPDELIAAVRIAPASGPQQFSKIGPRNAMVIAVCTFAIALHPDEQRVGTGIGSAAPTPIRAREAEEFLAAELDWSGRGVLPDSVAKRFGELVAQVATPIDDVRGSAVYRRHALSVMARRTLGWAWHEHCSGRQECA
ncbi:FAD binding domain-containing protein [Saccharopolyspora halophila]|uniref:FAD binding domain-containing protein n=1 Tax=Saccharopolyspora halophila TaxID=405551 RepID=A0ABN3G9P5_9PSEU